MTTEERFERIEHVTAGIVEQFRLEREENRALWRRTEQHIEEVASTVRALSEQVNRVTIDLDRSILESAARDRVLGERMDKLISAMGEFISRGKE